MHDGTQNSATTPLTYRWRIVAILILYLIYNNYNIIKPKYWFCICADENILIAIIHPTKLLEPQMKREVSQIIVTERWCFRHPQTWEYDRYRLCESSGAKLITRIFESHLESHKFTCQRRWSGSAYPRNGSINLMLQSENTPEQKLYVYESSQSDEERNKIK